MADSNESVGPTIVPTGDARHKNANPQPDGYSGHSHFHTAPTSSITGANGYIGDSEIAARADHVHPLNFCSSKPRPIGIPYGGSGSIGYIENGEKDFGLFGRIGIPPFGGTGHYISHELTNSYALSNHVHPYGFCTPTSTNASDSNRPYNTFPDGVNNRFSSVVLNTNGTVTPKYYWETPQPSGTDTTLKFGNSGVCPYPSRLDHTHPLNCRDLHVSSSTGDSVKDNIQPIDFDPTKSTSGYGASYGTDTFYARTDHVHPLPTGGTGATGVGSDNGTHSNAFETLSPSNDPDTQVNAYYGSGNFSQTWERDSTGNTNGFKINVVCSIGNRGYSNVLFFRTLTFDKYGLCREVSEVKEGVELQ